MRVGVRRGVGFWVVVGLVVMGGLTGCALPSRPVVATETLSVLTDNGQMQAIFEPAPERAPSLPREAAIERAGTVMARADQATTVSARLTVLSMQAADGELKMQPRPSWVVMYEGVAYTALAPGCACYPQSVPNTAVVLDAQDGRVLAAFGTSAVANG